MMATPSPVAHLRRTLSAAHKEAVFSSLSWKRRTSSSSNQHNPNSVAFDRMQHGVGCLVASYDTNTTRLTRVSHRAPARLIPLRSSSVQASGGAVCVLSNYGGGLLPGDQIDFHVHVESNARLGLVTQGSNRIYKPSQQQRQQLNSGTTAVQPSQTTVSATVERGGLLVMAPDPVTPFRTSLYRQEQHIVLQHIDTSLCLVDWFSAGRFTNGERWQQTSLHNTTKLYMAATTSSSMTTTDNDRNSSAKHSGTGTDDDDDGFTATNNRASLVLMDSTRLDRQPNESYYYNNNLDKDDDDVDEAAWGMDWSSVHFNAYASILLYGDQVVDVIDRCHEIQHALALQQTNRIRPRRSMSVVNHVNETNHKDDDDDDDTYKNVPTTSSTTVLDTLSGRVLLGISRCPLPITLMSSQQQHEKDDDDDSNRQQHKRVVHVARFAATSNEDLYRIFHYALKPLSTQFGIELYKDRIRAVYSSPLSLDDNVAVKSSARATVHDDDSTSGPTTTTSSGSSRPLRGTADTQQSCHHGPNLNAATATSSSRSSSSSSSAYWSAYMLADSALPVGSFAHSSGLEAASQLQLLTGGPADVARYVHAATRSTLQLAAPLIRQSHAWAWHQLQQSPSPQPSSNPVAVDHAAWQELDQYAQALLVSNEPACRASLDQGRSLLRVALQWLQSQKEKNHKDNQGPAGKQKQQVALFLLQSLQRIISGGMTTPSPHGHLATVFGVVTAIMELDGDQACQLLGYCVARDMVSAAVRLNLVGPMASVGMIANAQDAAEQGLRRNNCTLSGGKGELFMAAGCSPVVDAIQPCHDLLSTRLFRT